MPTITTSACDAVPARPVVFDAAFVLAPADADAELALHAFPGAARVGFGDVGLPPAWRVRADAATAGVRRACGDAGAALLVTSLDLWHPDLATAVGFADARRGAAVVSFARLRDAGDDRRTAHRVRNVAAHEHGHLRGLRHCARAACVMHPADGPGVLDARGAAPCSECAARLAGAGWRRWIGLGGALR